MLALKIFLLQYVYSYCQEFEFSDFESRVKKGQETFEKFKEDALHKNSRCWQSALQMVDLSCRKMSDIHQSYLALQFTNCHLEKSGLQTYPCRVDNFRECTKEMASNIIAFNSYTQFFTHVSDICFYYQSDIWREKTETTIQKLTKTSEESLNTLSESVRQQKVVLSTQEESLKNQKDILKNEQLLKETLLSSAQSAKDVFEEVRDHAQQQKTMFSETFDSIFESVEKLANLQKMLLGEFIGLQSVAFYFVATIVCYLFTSTPQTTGARLFLFGSLTVLILFERIFISRKVASDDQQVTSEDIHERIWVLRKIFLAVATIILGVFIIRYKDFNKINYCMLQNIQSQISELYKLQQNQTGHANGGDSVDCTLVPEKEAEREEREQKLNEATKQLELSLQSFVTSTPHKTLIETQGKMSSQNETTKTSKLKKQYSLAEFSDEDDFNATVNIATRNTRKEDADKKKRQKSVQKSLNDSRYNLRSKSSSGLGISLFDAKIVKPTNATKVKPANETKVKRKLGRPPKNTRKKKPAFFSSDED